MKVPNTLIEKAAAKKDVRVNLNNPYLDTKKKRLIATNGHIAAFVPVEVSAKDISGPVPAEVLKAARRAAKHFIVADGPEIICAKATLAVTNGPSFPRPELDSKFPNVDQVVPKTKGWIKVGLDAQLLIDLALAIGEGKYKTHVCLHIDPKNSQTAAVYVSNKSDRYGVIMPMRL